METPTLRESALTTASLEKASLVQIGENRYTYTAESSADRVTLITNDGVSFEGIPQDLIEQCGAVAGSIESCGTNNSIPLPQIESWLMPKIIEFLKHYLVNPPEEGKNTVKGEGDSAMVTNTVLSEFDKAWLPTDKDDLGHLLMASSYLQCADITNACSQETADRLARIRTEIMEGAGDIKEKDQAVREAFQRFFDVPDEELPSPEEQAEIKKRHCYLYPREEKDN